MAAAEDRASRSNVTAIVQNLEFGWNFSNQGYFVGSFWGDHPPNNDLK